MKYIQENPGTRYGSLVVLEDLGCYAKDNTKFKRHYIKCACDCGNMNVIVQANNLHNGNTTTCGCVRAEKMRSNMKKYNQYDLESEDYGIGYTTKGEPFYFDKSDYDKIKDKCWSIAADESVVSDGGRTYFHRFLFDVTDSSIQVDHISHVREDNRRINLRLSTNSENSRNKGLQANNTSGVTGVSWDKDTQSWRVTIVVNKKRIDFGRFKDKKQAIQVRKEAEEKYHKDRSYDNSIIQAINNGSVGMTIKLETN